jgi:6-phosphofructokinase 2
MLPIVTLTANPAIDISVSTQKIVPTHKLRCHDSRRDPGGGGINVARVVKRLGGNVRCIYPAGGLAGAALQDLVDREGLKSRVVKIAGETRENFTAFEETSHEQYRFVLPGPELLEAEWRQCLSALEMVNPAQGFACASGSLSPGLPADFYACFAATAESVGLMPVLDTSGIALEKALKVPLYLIKPNHLELSELLGRNLETETDQLGACKTLIGQGRVQMIALTLGADGAFLVTKDHAFRARCGPIMPVSAVGAGDSFMGALLWALASNLTLSEALRHGVAAGTAAVLAHGTELCDANTLHRLLPQIIVSDAHASATA